jgi:AcrR family transcriptional regulator
MAGKKHATTESGGRLSAYTTRNRASLVKAAQEVLAEVGLNATVEQLSAHAQVSPTTIYNHFDNKEVLFSEALEHAWRDWVMWAYDGAPAGQSLQDMMDVCRKLFRANHTHPLFAKILNKTLDDPSFVLRAVSVVGMSDLKAVTSHEGLALQNFDEQSYLWSYCLAGILHRVYVEQDATPEEADSLLELSLQILDISKAKAKKIVSRPLVFPSTSQ